MLEIGCWVCLTCQLGFGLEQVFHFIIASVKSGKAVDMSDTLIGLLHPLLSLQVSATILFGDVNHAFDLNRVSPWGHHALCRCLSLSGANWISQWVNGSALKRLRIFQFRRSVVTVVTGNAGKRTIGLGKDVIEACPLAPISDFIPS